MTASKSNNKLRMEEWKVTSDTSEGFHECIIPGKQDCKVVHIYRLNLNKGSKYTLKSNDLEMNPVLLKGRAHVACDAFETDMDKLDSFYITGNMEVEIEALEDLTFYIGAAICEGYGKPFFRKFDPDLPLGEIHQIHGEGVGQREVFFTLNPEKDSSRLLCGLTWGGNGSWTSWPPHQHEKDLEEAYCYFDMDEPRFGFHMSYLKSGEVEESVAHVVRSGDMVLAPVGYHPTVASPGTQNTYFWVLAAHSHESRRYDLAVLDPVYKDAN
jgi:5-deoxy-glucuronate isomerase